MQLVEPAHCNQSVALPLRRGTGFPSPQWLQRRPEPGEKLKKRLVLCAWTLNWWWWRRWCWCWCWWWCCWWWWWWWFSLTICFEPSWNAVSSPSNNGQVCGDSWAGMHRCNFAIIIVVWKTLHKGLFRSRSNRNPTTETATTSFLKS